MDGISTELLKTGGEAIVDKIYQTASLNISVAYFDYNKRIGQRPSVGSKCTDINNKRILLNIT